jgi:regulator of cell morphogenesis and NO signaling
MTPSKFESATLSDLVARDFRAGAILDRYGLDYCCGGARTLAEGCLQRGINLVAVLSELEALDPDSRGRVAEDPAALVDYIVLRHHAYVRTSLPIIQEHLTRVVAAHGANHTELTAVAAAFAKVARELTQHMVKEEQVLFPHIRALAEAVRSGGPPPPDMFGTVQNPIRMMEIEHEVVGDALASIRSLTGGYQPPADACPTYRLVLEELVAFERDLDAHVHLEDRVLFPKAVELESALEHATRGLKCQPSEMGTGDI